MKNFALRMSTAACLFATVSSLHAQTAEQGADRAQLEEVVVTAQKRVENVQDVPLAVSVVTENQMESAGVRTARDFSRYGGVRVSLSY